MMNSSIQPNIPDCWKGKEDIFNRIDQKSGDWGGLKVTWSEVNGEKKIEHLYQYNVNLKTGDLYLDCTKAKLVSKCMVYVLIKPFMFAAKTLGHLSGISLAVGIYQEVQKIKNEEKDGNKISLKDKTVRHLNVLKNELCDIVRTPIYGVALTAIGLVGATVAPFAPKSFIFKVVETIGKIEVLLNRGNKESGWILFACFLPIQTINSLNTLETGWGSWNYKNTEYPNEVTPTEKGLINLAGVQINFRRKNRAIFNDCFRLLPPDVRYVSPYAKG